MKNFFLSLWESKGTIIGGALVLFLVFNAGRCSAQELVIATGNLKTGTYSKMFSELNRYCQPSTIGIMIKQRETSGSPENLDLLLGNKVNGAILQSDLLFAARAADESKTAQIKTLFGLHPEELHWVARADVKKEGGYGFGSVKIGGQKVEFKTLTDLMGRPVGAVGGSVLSAQVVSQLAGLNLQVQQFDNNDQLKAALLDGKVDAILVVGGAPHPLVASLSKDYRLLPMDPAMQDRVKDVYTKTKVGYENLGQAGVPTVATQALFVTRVYSSDKMNKVLATLRKCMKDNLGDIKDALGTHAKWQDVDAANDGKWPVYQFK